MAEPSFIAKLRRAEKHLADLKVEIDRYAARHPYTVRTGFEGKNKPKVRRLQFTEYPADTEIPLITADLLYNIRSGLDHVMSALVHPSKKRSVYFPIFFQGVWEEPIPGEEKQRGKERERWQSYTATIDPAARAVLKILQPRDGARDDDPTINFLSALNRLAVKDRHVKLPFIAPSLFDYRVTCTRADGATKVGWTDGRPNMSVEDGAEIKGIPEETVDVEIEGTPVITVKVGGPNSNLKIPESLSEGISKVERLILAPLTPFIV